MAKRTRTRSYQRDVATARRQLETPPEVSRSLPEFMQQDVALFAAGYSVAQIARATGRTRQAVSESLRTAALAKDAK